jgi:hypothetical protein
MYRNGFRAWLATPTGLRAAQAALAGRRRHDFGKMPAGCQLPGKVGNLQLDPTHARQEMIDDQGNSVSGQCFESLIGVAFAGVDERAQSRRSRLRCEF